MKCLGKHSLMNRDLFKIGKGPPEVGPGLKIYKTPSGFMGNCHKSVHCSLNELNCLCKSRSDYLELLGSCVWRPMLRV